MSEKVPKMDLPSLDNLFTTQKERDEASMEKVQKIPLNKIKDFPNHPFKVNVDDSLYSMVDSIKENGLLEPVLVRPTEDGYYEMVSGHRRKLACELAQYTEIDAVVRNMTDDEATIIMVDSNIQREKILPSEKAFAYKMKLEAMKHQGKRVDLLEEVTSDRDGRKLRNPEITGIIGKISGDSQSQVKRYIRLTYLIPELLNKVDNATLGFSQAVELSYISEDYQQLINNKMDFDEISPSVSQAKSLRILYDQNNLNEDLIEKTLGELKPNQLENQNIKYRELRHYFPENYTNDKIKSVIQKLCEEYYNRWHNKERNDAR